MIRTLKTVFTHKTHEGTTERLLQYAFSYFGLYVITGYLAKYFAKTLAMGGNTYTVYNTIGGLLICNLVVIIWGWYKFKSTDRVNFLGMNMPREFFYIIPSGICTAVIIPTTTLMYVLPISVMVAMIIMRASVIIISRIIDTIQIKQGVLNKIVYWEENVGVVFALIAVSIKFIYVKPGDFDFLHNVAAMTILGSYLTAYSIRIYIMNYYKNTRKKDAIYDTKGFFAVEQIASTLALITAGAILFYSVDLGTADPKTFGFQFKDCLVNTPALWKEGIMSGLPFGAAAFFSVFLFMFKGRTATFAGLVNRVTSLVAGTVATLVVWWLIAGQKPPAMEDWFGLAAIFIAIYFMGKAERKRACELAKEHEIEPEKGSEVICDTTDGPGAAKA
ncbi:MAG: hypothetical protein COT18_01345 [Elusimicrobia bacterium CG08_land_8_20_14_0_20_59_10]|nr:MAG: hypothetical protein COT18_01345 [Elusimicrobia bacterium CG08_land_8_20_14_0_20_59_10]